MINSVKTGAYNQHTVKFNNAKSTQPDLFHKANESVVFNYFHNDKDTAEISQETKEMMGNAPLEAEAEKAAEKKDKKDITEEWKEKSEQLRRDMNRLKDEMQRAEEIAEGMGEAMREMIKCMRIAMRIMSGHKVPEADHRYLMEKDTALYSKAIMMRREIPDPEELERLSEDEEETEASSEIDELPTPTPETSTEASGEAFNTDNAVDIEA